jgi:hypothetical protein
MELKITMVTYRFGLPPATLLFTIVSITTLTQMMALPNLISMSSLGITALICSITSPRTKN